MKIISCVALLLLSGAGYVESAPDKTDLPSITVNFDKYGDDYRASCVGESHLSDHVNFKMFGKHLKSELKADGTRYGNADVKIFNASNSGNTFEKFPELVCELFVNLRDIYMESTKLKNISKSSFEKCTKLENIFFANDEIISIDSGVFSACVNLKTINFNGNEINYIDSGAFKNLTKLESLTLIGSNFTEIDSKLFASLTGLKELTINDQPLKSLSDNLFENLANLEVLNLNNNELEKVSSAWFNGKENIQAVDLSSNKITMVDSNLLKLWRNQASLNLENNVCIDKNFGKIGTDAMPTAEATEALEICFLAYDDELKVKPIESNNGDESEKIGDEETVVAINGTQTEKGINTTGWNTKRKTDDSDDEESDDEDANDGSEGDDDDDDEEGGDDEDEYDSGVKEKPDDKTTNVSDTRNPSNATIDADTNTNDPSGDNETDDDSDDDVDGSESVSKPKNNATRSLEDDDDFGIFSDKEEFDSSASNSTTESVYSTYFYSSNETTFTDTRDEADIIAENRDETDIDNDDETTSIVNKGNSSFINKIKKIFTGTDKTTNSVAINKTDSSNLTDVDTDIFEIDDGAFSKPHDADTDELIDFDDDKVKNSSVVVLPSNATKIDSELSGNSDEDESFLVKKKNSTVVDEDDIDFPTGADTAEIEAANKTFADVIKSGEVGLSEDNFKFPEIDDNLSPFNVEEGENIEEKPATEEIPAESTEDDYKKYEKADSRFYVSADKEYTAIIYGVSDTMRYIKMNHLEGYGNLNVTVVFIRECSELKHIPPVIFKKFKNIKSLSINKCGITHMGPRFMNECGKLEHLDVRFNLIESVKGESVKNCANLKTLDLSNNDVSAIDSDVLKCNPELNIIVDSLRIGAPKSVSKS